jgi:hypothetical protein
MVTKLLLALALLQIASNSSAECDCIWGGPFTRVQGGTDLVVSATVTASKGNSIDLHLNNILRGQEHMEIIRVWLDSGQLCRPSAELFPPDSQWVMALQRIDEAVPGGFNPNTPNISYGRIGDYSLSKCGGYWLSQSENLVRGNLAQGPRWEMNPKMSPVLLDLVAGFVRGELDEKSLKEAGNFDPELQLLILDTRSFLRQQR